ncbi:MAG: pyridoxamine kinase [Oscillospiraceae bacterium]|nr:pyridoxamine kinase [Oscillospiraceae bacterium]
MKHTPKVAAIHDISGYGRCSLTVALPTLAAMGVQCCPMPTAYLSAHTAFPPSAHAVFLDLSDQMAQTAAHWTELHAQFDAIYSGFLGSARQADLLADFISCFRRGGETLVLVDPVMGDNGKPYRTYTPELCRKMRTLAALADVITPNLTEAAILLDQPYSSMPTDRAGLEALLTALSLGGKRSVVLTGVSLADGSIGSACLERTHGEISFHMSKEETGYFHGTGDLFASVLLGGLLRGECLGDATARAVSFVQTCIAHTLRMGAPVLEGVVFEPLLGALAQG